MLSVYLLICWLWWSCVYSSEPGHEDCGTTVNLTSVNNTIIYVNASLDTVCFECDYTHFLGLIREVVFGVNDTNVTANSTLGRVVNNYPHDYTDTLVVNGSGNVFSTFWDTNIQCCEKRLCNVTYFMAKVGALLFKVFNPPSIMGETEVIEGNTLHLLCDGSNSDPQPNLQWISPDGKMVSESGELDIVTTTRNITGIYTCVATLPRSTTTMNTTVDIKIILPIDCPTLNSTDTMMVNMSSTAVGSTATYQCRDGPTDVYTTQCTSTGVWDPHPLSTLDCETGVKDNGARMSVPVEVIVPVTVAVVCIAGILIVATVIAVVCVLRRRQTNTKKKKQNRALGEHVITFAHYSSCNDNEEGNPDPTSTTFTDHEAALNELYSIPRSVLATAETINVSTVASTEPEQTKEDQSTVVQPGGVVREQENKKTVQNPAYGEVRMTAGQLSGGISVVQTRYEPDTADNPPVTHRRLVQEDDGGIFDIFCEPTHASLDYNAVVTPPPPDTFVCLDQILIQLREVTPHWRKLGEAVGVHRLDEISEYVDSESEAMVEVVDGWLANLHPNKPTWREIADVVDSIGHHDLAHSLRQVYISVDCPHGCGEKGIKRKDLKIHRCSLQPADCPFAHVGCVVKTSQREMDAHCRDNMQDHLLMMARSLQELSDKNKDLVQKNEELTRKNEDLTSKNEALSCKVEDIDKQMLRKYETLGGEIDHLDESVQMEGGVLTVYDTEETFGGAESGSGSTSTAFSLSCSNGIDNVTAAVYVESFEPPVITGETTIVEGDDLLLQCNAPISIISPFLMWLDSAGQVITQTADLVITNFTRDMAGIYTCVATYTITTSFIINATASVMVQISDLPVISGENTITEGGTLNLVCRGANSYADPQPTLQWFSPTGAELSTIGSLEIVNVTRDMMGAFTCVATDPTTSATTNSTVIVIIQSCNFYEILKLYPPVVVVISEGGTLVVVSEGKTLQLTCSIVGNPSPNYVYWTRGGIQLSNSSDHRVTVETYSTSSTTLTIVGVRGSEGGEYTCSADSDVGNGSETTSVTVQARQPILFEAIQVPNGTTGGCPDTTQTRATIYSELRMCTAILCVTNCTSDNYVAKNRVTTVVNVDHRSFWFVHDKDIIMTCILLAVKMMSVFLSKVALVQQTLAQK
ncbi:Peroxidasin [Geodia barretti]|uniref:Peroxidasin n=1 Tax=Geodia barretti TaxID=519541 RepID=A0AA35RV51_GEOBA|nr:Peroxidasin [Geodia barretti]